MKNFIVLLLITLFAGGNAHSQEKAAGNTMVEVYYFHGKQRCATCKSIEENSGKTVDTYFKDQKAKGIVKMKVIDIDDPKNKALVEKYEASGSALFVTYIKAGRTFTFDMTNFAFSYSRSDTPKFMQGLKDKITLCLNK